MNDIEVYKELYANLIEYHKAVGSCLELYVDDIDLGIMKIYSDNILELLFDYNNEQTIYEVMKLFDPDFAEEFNSNFLKSYTNGLFELIKKRLYDNYNVLYDLLVDEIKILIGHDKMLDNFLINLLKGSHDDYERHLSVNFDFKAGDELSFIHDKFFLKLIGKDYYPLIKYIDDFKFSKSGNLTLEFPEKIPYSRAEGIKSEIQSVISKLNDDKNEKLRYVLSVHFHLSYEIYKMVPTSVKDALKNMKKIQDSYEINYFT